MWRNEKGKNKVGVEKWRPVERERETEVIKGTIFRLLGFVSGRTNREGGTGTGRTPARGALDGMLKGFLNGRT